MAKQLAAYRSAGSVNGWSMGFEKFKTTLPAVYWERKYAKAGLIAAAVSGAAVGAFSWAVVTVGAPLVLLAMGGIGVATIGGIYFYQFLDRDLKED